MSSPEPRLHRSYLYCPASSHALVPRALRAGADAVVFDLEDAVAPSQRDDARSSLRTVLDGVHATAGPHPADQPLERGQPDLHVRVSRDDGDRYGDADLDAVVVVGLAGIRLPKADDPDEIRRVDGLVSGLESSRGIPHGTVGLYPIIESATGATRVRDIARACPRIVRIAFGETDFLADIGAWGDDAIATAHVRSTIVVESRAAGIGPPIDSVHTDVDDTDGLRARAEAARAIGFHGKSVIHPRQLSAVHEVFGVSPARAEQAHRIVDAADAALREGDAAILLDGQLVDPAVVARARAVLRLGGS